MPTDCLDPPGLAESLVLVDGRAGVAPKVQEALQGVVLLGLIRSAKALGERLLLERVAETSDF